MRPRGFCASGSAVCHRPYVVSLVDADVRDDVVSFACVVGGRTIGVTQGYKASEIGNAMGISIEAVETGPNTGKELIKQPEWRNQIATRNGYGLNLAP